MILEHVSCLNVAHSVILKVAAWNVDEYMVRNLDFESTGLPAHSMLVHLLYLVSVAEIQSTPPNMTLLVSQYCHAK
jgi:hypothetical protein